MSSTIDPNAFLMGGGTKSAKFEQVSDTVRGRVVSFEMRQQTEMGTNVPKTWDDGTPKMQLQVVLATDERDATDPDDDGHRAVYLKGGKAPTTTQGAVAAALKAAGANGLEVGGTLALKFTGLGVASKPGLNPPKQYAAQYTPPAPTVGLDAF